MLNKKRGITNSDFDTVITGCAKEDLRSVGIASSLIDLIEDDAEIEEGETRQTLIKTAVITYVQSLFDIEFKDAYQKSYDIQKRCLKEERRLSRTRRGGIIYVYRNIILSNERTCV